MSHHMSQFDVSYYMQITTIMSLWICMIFFFLIAYERKWFGIWDVFQGGTDQLFNISVAHWDLLYEWLMSLRWNVIKNNFSKVVFYWSNEVTILHMSWQF